MTAGEIRGYFGDYIADECERMTHGEEQDFTTATFEGIHVRCEQEWWGKVYYVTGEFILEEALVPTGDEIYDGMDMGM